MESLNLTTLASSLPTANLQNAEKDLLNNFKAAALSITTLYRSSRHTSKRAYNAGYAAACQDLLMMIQQGVSAGGIGLGTAPGAGPHDAEGSGMTIGRVMDWIEARLEAIKSREEEEDEDEEKERERDKVRASETKADQKASSTPAPSNSGVRQKDQVVPMLPTPNSPRTRTTAQPSSQPSSPSPPPSSAPPTTTLRPIHLHSHIRPTRSRSNLIKEASSVSLADPTPSPTTTPQSSALFTESHAQHNPIAGSKRRHAVMMILDSSIPSASGTPSHAHPPIPGIAVPGTNGGLAGGSRRRTKSGRSHQNLHHNQNMLPPQGGESMDVEEDGRERKRVARR